jgi:hypothetical protein
MRAMPGVPLQSQPSGPRGEKGPAGREKTQFRGVRAAVEGLSDYLSRKSSVPTTLPYPLQPLIKKGREHYASGLPVPYGKECLAIFAPSLNPQILHDQPVKIGRLVLVSHEAEAYLDTGDVIGPGDQLDIHFGAGRRDGCDIFGGNTG